MSINLKTIDFQEKAIERIYNKTIEFLKIEKKGDDYKKIIFQSPTGSGKTVMTSKIVEKIALESDEKVSFIWVSKGQLSEQSKKSFEKYIGGGALRFSSLEDILDNEIKENEVLFTNWEKIFSRAKRDNLDKDVKKGDYTNIFMRENEWDRNLKTFCENTREAGRKIILIIDESHLTITQNTIQLMAEIIKPYLRIDITATPKKNENYDYGNRDGEFITLEQVKEAQVIKKEVVINANIKNSDLTIEDGDLVIFKKAIEKRDELLKLYKKVGSKVKPLILIQLPNDGVTLSVTDKSKIDWVEDFLDEKYNVNYENGKLAKWLSDKKDKVNLDRLTELDSDVEFLIFKQAIATGWDCPRSQILIKFRETKSETFEIQTVGRIMRSPEFKHYEEEKLNRAYVYANLSEIKIDEDAFEYIKTKIAKRKSEYKNLDLHSIYLMRGEYNDLRFEYRKYFYKAFLDKINGEDNLEKFKENFNKFKNYKNKDGVGLKLSEDDLTDKIILDEIIDNIDKDDIDLKAQNENKSIVSDDEIEKKFIDFLKKNTGEYQQARSFDKIRLSIYHIFEKYLKMGESMMIHNWNIDKMNKTFFQKLVLKNQWFFREVIEDSITEYSKNRERVGKSIKINETWNIPTEDFYSKNSIEGKHKRSIMSPSFYESEWKTEVGFIENYLEKSKTIDWWYKNGDAKNEIYFGILFKDGDIKKTFYPDFIVQYSDGRVGIFDTKMGDTAKSDDTKLKANALAKYIKEWNDKGKKLFGGIVIPISKEYKNFKLNENKELDYKYNDGKGDSWRELV